MSWTRWMLLLAVVSVSTPALRAADWSKSDLAKQREAQKAARAVDLKNWEQIPGEFRLADLFRSRVVDGRVVVVATLPSDMPAHQRCRLRIAGTGQEMMAQVYENPDQTNCHLLFYSFDDPEAVETATTISFEMGTVSMIRRVNLGGKFRNVSLTQTIMKDGAPSVKLVVEEAPPPRGGKKPIVVTGADYVALRQANIDAVMQHALPILSDLGLADVLATDPGVPWRVFGKDWAVDPATEAKLQKLLPQLDSEQWRERNAAAGELRAGGEEMRLAILKMERQGLTMEQKTVLDAALGLPEVGDERAAKLREDKEFLLDCLYCLDGRVVASATAELKRITGKAIEVDAKENLGKRHEKLMGVRRELLGK